MTAIENGMIYVGDTSGPRSTWPPGTPVPGSGGDIADRSFDDPYGHYGPPSSVSPISPVDPRTGAPFSPSPRPLPMPAVPGPIDRYEPGEIQSASLVTGFVGLAAIAGPTVARWAWPIIRTAIRATGGSIVRWAGLPGWLRSALLVVGITAGTDFALDAADIGPDQPGGGITPFIPGPGETLPGVGNTMNGETITKMWVANGTPFVRLMNGKIGAMKKDGSWKFWRPKKPTVIYAGGMSNVRDVLKADAVIDKQIKKLKKVINRRHPTRRRAPTAADIHHAK